MKRTALIVAAITAFFAQVSAGVSDSDSTKVKVDTSLQSMRAMISVQAALPGVRVYVDSQYVGTTPFDSIRIADGIHILRFIHPQAKRWVNEAITETVSVHPGEFLIRKVVFPDFLFVTSEPSGATVRAYDRMLGETPLSLRSSDAPTFITISKDGFQEATVPAATTVDVSLQPLVGTALAASAISPFLSTNDTKTSLPIYLTTAAAVISGTAAAYFKIKADNAYSDYRQNGDQASLDRVHRNDTFSGVGLVACEVNLLALTYFLFSR